MNSLVRNVLTEIATARKRLGDPREAVFADAPPRPEGFFPRAVKQARSALAGAGQDPAQLDGYTWHANRHTWASRLTMTGVDPRTIMALGGWSNTGMLARYSHLTPGHLQAAVEKLAPAVILAELERKLTSGRGLPPPSAVSPRSTSAAPRQPIGQNARRAPVSIRDGVPQSMVITNVIVQRIRWHKG